MGRIVEVFVMLNALGGIATFLGFRYAGRKARDRVLGRHNDEGGASSTSEPKNQQL